MIFLYFPVYSIDNGLKVMPLLIKFVKDIYIYIYISKLPLQMSTDCEEHKLIDFLFFLQGYGY